MDNWGFSALTDESDDPLWLKDGYHDDNEMYSQIKVNASDMQDAVMDGMPDTKEQAKPQTARGIMGIPVFIEIPAFIKSAAAMEKVKRWYRMQELARN